jgi:hypothetical protein
MRQIAGRIHAGVFVDTVIHTVQHLGEARPQQRPAVQPGQPGLRPGPCAKRGQARRPLHGG